MNLPIIYIIELFELHSLLKDHSSTRTSISGLLSQEGFFIFDGLNVPGIQLFTYLSKPYA